MPQWLPSFLEANSVTKQFLSADVLFRSLNRLLSVHSVPSQVSFVAEVPEFVDLSKRAKCPVILVPFLKTIVAQSTPCYHSSI
jgi:hypothetical protein